MKKDLGLPRAAKTKRTETSEIFNITVQSEN